MGKKIPHKSKYHQYTKEEIDEAMQEQVEFKHFWESHNGGKSPLLDLILLMDYLRTHKVREQKDGRRVVIINRKVVVL